MASTRRTKPVGRVAFVGGGPGDAGLLTVRGRDLLAAADVVVVDPDVPSALLDGCRADADLCSVSDDAEDGLRVNAVAPLLVSRAKAGATVVRLVSGDPFLLRACSREAAACAKAGVSWEVVPGVPTGIAGPAYAGVPITDGATAHDVTFVDGTVETAPGATDWAALSATTGTVVVLGGAERIGKIAAGLVEHGRDGDTPVAVISAPATADQRTLVSTLDTVERDVASATLAEPVVTVIGDVVRLRDKLSWWESRPLFGMRVLVPRTRQQAGALSEQLRLLGATPVELPTIAIEPPRNDSPMDRAVTGLVQGRYAWIAFTSTNSVRSVRERLEAIGLDARVFAGVRIAAVGDATADALAAFGLRPDLVPSSEMSGEALAREWPWHDDQLDPLDRVLLPRADIATETLVNGLKEKGWAVEEVTAYRTIRAAAPPVEMREAVRGGRFDAVVFTSSSTVRNLVALAGKPGPATRVAAIGPQTAATAQELGLRVDVIAEHPSVAGLAAALASFVAAEREAPAPTKPARAPRAKARSAR
ncbi:MAG TPA: uroporphyrinogen-III C-methyltransferase [Mycobacteriales bacterium]|nr:uroporphyrinogen-III C-methyltransferase [Mycobacteriales bacterium]